MEEEEKGITIGEIFKVIFGRVWWVIGVTAAILIAFVCVMEFWYNRNHREYIVQYEVRLPSGETYPDGQPLYAQDSIALANLNMIKSEGYLTESDRTGKFKDIDIEGMVENDDITFSLNMDENPDGTYTYHNNIAIKGKYFKDEDTAVAFIKAVAEYPVYHALEIVRNLGYTYDLTRYDAFDTYQERFDALVAQRNYILNTYQSLINLYGSSYKPAGMSSTLGDYDNELINIFDEEEQESIRNSYQHGHLVFVDMEEPEAKLDSIDRQIEIINAQIESNQTIINELYTEIDNVLDKFTADVAVKEISAFNERIAALTQSNGELKNNLGDLQSRRKAITDYQSGTNKAEKEKIDTAMGDARDSLEQCAQTLKQVNIATYGEKAQVVFVNNKIEVEGGMNIILAAVIGLVLGFVLVSVVILIIDLPKYKKAKAAGATAPAPAEGGTGEQAPAEEDGKKSE